MANANIVITQSAVAGQPGRSRNDIVLAQPVTLSNADNTGVTTRRWRLVERPDGSAASLDNPLGATCSFTPDVAGTYIFELIINEGRTSAERQRRIAAVTETIGLVTGLRMPGALENDEANWLISGVENTRGWAPDLFRWLRASASAVGDHGSLSGLGDDDHTQYVLVTGARAFNITAASPSCIVGDGTGSPSLELRKSDAGTATIPFRVAAVTRQALQLDGSENLLITTHDNTGVIVATTTLSTSGAWTMPSNLTLSSASPAIVIGSGTGSPLLRLDAVSGGTPSVVFRANGVNRSSLLHDASNNYNIRAHDAAGAVTFTTTYLNSSGEWRLPSDLNVALTSFASFSGVSFGATATRQAQVGTTTSTGTVASKLYVNEGSRNSRAQFFLTDAAAFGGAWGHWLTFSSGGYQPYVVGMVTSTLMRLSAPGDGVASFIVGSPGTNATANGQAMLVAGGIGGATSGNGGALTTRGGAAPTSGTGGAATHTTGDGAGGNNVAGAMLVTVGASFGSGTAPAISITGGRSVTGAGSAINVTTGQGGTTSGDSGALNLATGSVVAGGTGSISVSTPNAVGGSNNAGAFTVALGNSTGVQNGPNISLTAGGCGSTANSNVGGSVIATAGPGIGTGNPGGTIELYAGTPADANGSPIIIQASNGVGTDRDGGGIDYTTGSATDTSTPGAHTFRVNGSEVHMVVGAQWDGATFAHTFGIFGQAPAFQQALPVAATDLATVITLANNIRLALLEYGLCYT